MERASEAYGVFGRVGSDGSGEQSFGVEQRCVWHGATMAMDEWRVDKWMKNNVENRDDGDGHLGSDNKDCDGSNESIDTKLQTIIYMHTS